MNQLNDDEMDAMREAGLAVEDIKRMEQMEERRKESEAKMKLQARARTHPHPHPRTHYTPSLVYAPYTSNKPYRQ